MRSNVTPVVRGGALAGYMPVRTQPARGEVQATEQLYQSFREGKAGSKRFLHGLIVRTGPMACASLPQTMPLHWRLSLGVFGLAAAAAAGAWAAGVRGPGFALLSVWPLAACALASLWLSRQITRPLAQYWPRRKAWPRARCARAQTSPASTTSACSCAA